MKKHFIFGAFALFSLAVNAQNVPLVEVPQPVGLEGHAIIPIDQTTAKKGFERLKYWRRNAIYGEPTAKDDITKQSILWNDKKDGKDNWIPLLDYLKNHNISVDEYLNPKWSQERERFSVQRALESSLTLNHLRTNDTDANIGLESWASQSSNTLHGDIESNMDILAGEKWRWIAGSTKGDWTHGTTGHYESLVDPGVPQYGLSEIHHNLILSGGYDKNAANEDFLNWTGNYEFKLIFTPATIDKYTTGAKLQGYFIEAGKPIKLNLVAESKPVDVYPDHFPINFVGAYKSLNPDIVTADAMRLTGVKAGKAKLMFQSGGMEIGPYEVEVIEAKLQSIDYPKEYETIGRNAPLLPKTVKATYSDGSVRDIPVYWEDDRSYDNKDLWIGDKSYQQKGNVPGYGDIEVTVKIKSDDNPAIADKMVETKAGVAPVLPTSGRVVGCGTFCRWRDVKWDAIPPSAYAKAGNVFRVFGRLANGSHWIVANVTVLSNNLATIEENISKTSAYPNPTSNLFYIENPKNGANRVEIYDITGNLVKTQFTHNESVIEISLQSLPKGVYIYKMGNISGKVLKN